MIIFLLEVNRFFSSGGVFTLLTMIYLYFWTVWLVKVIGSLNYRPFKAIYRPPESICIPAYKEEYSTLQKSIALVMAQMLAGDELLIGIDTREERMLRPLLEEDYGDSIRVIVCPKGKRKAISLLCRSARNEAIVVVESDTFLRADALEEIVRPLATPEVAGVVGDQQVYEPYASIHNFLNWVLEALKYRLTMPMLSTRGEVTVLGGRFVAFKRSAVLPLLPSLEDEPFSVVSILTGGLLNQFESSCVSGDDGRLTSLLLQAGWQCVYQSTAISDTISPPTYLSLVEQRLRWFRNSWRRTMRALLCVGEKYLPDADRTWVYKRKLAMFQMLTTWFNTGMFTFALYLHFYALSLKVPQPQWGLLGNDYPVSPLMWVLVFITGTLMTRFLRAWPAFREVKPLWWFAVVFIPIHFLVMWGTRVCALATMNTQGWLTRRGGPGGFGQRKPQPVYNPYALQKVYTAFELMPVESSQDHFSFFREE